MIDIAKIEAFDVETGGEQPLFGLQPCRHVQGQADIITAAVAYWDAGKIEARGLEYPDVDWLFNYLTYARDQGVHVLCWNAPFDVAWVLAGAKRAKRPDLRALVYKTKWLDGLLIYRHSLNAPRFRPEGQMSLSLKPAVEKFIPSRAGYADDIDYENDHKTPEGRAKLLRYNKRDSAFTLAIACKVLTELPPEMVRNILIEARAIPDVAETMVEGIVLNAEACQKLGEKLEEQRRVAYVTLKLNSPEVSEEVLRSPTKLRELMFKQWGLPVVELTDTNEPSTNKATLTELALTDERAKLVHEYRDAEYCKAKFSTSPLASLAYNGDGVSRPNARIFGTYSGRMTYGSKVGRGAGEQPSGVAIHQWKRDPAYREIIEPPEGYDLLEFDFAGQEFRWMAVESGDPQMLQLCLPGEDPHAFMGARIDDCDYRWLQANASTPEGKPKRQLGKVGNLSLQYRTSAITLIRVAAVQYGVKLTPITAKAIWSTYRTTYRRVPVYWKTQIQKARAFGFVETLAGRRVNLGDVSSWVWIDEDGQRQDYTWGHESTAINFPIQGVGADQKYLGILCMHELCTQFDARFYFELHDGLFYICPKDKSERFAHAAKQLLSNLPYQRAWGVKLPIDFPVDGKRGPSWGRLKEFH